MKLSGRLRRIIGMSYDRAGTGSSFEQTANSSIQLRVPFVPQRHVNLCSDASALMILQAWGFETKVTTKANPRGVLQGASLKDHVDFAAAGRTEWEDLGLNKKQKVSDYIHLLSHFGPIGCSFSRRIAGKTIGHCVVLIGGSVDGNRLTMHDPWRGPRTQHSLESFHAMLDEMAYLGAVGATRVSEQRREAAWKQAA